MARGPLVQLDFPSFSKHSFEFARMRLKCPSKVDYRHAARNFAPAIRVRGHLDTVDSVKPMNPFFPLSSKSECGSRKYTSSLLL